MGRSLAGIFPPHGIRCGISLRRPFEPPAASVSRQFRVLLERRNSRRRSVRMGRFRLRRMQFSGALDLVPLITGAGPDGSQAAIAFLTFGSTDTRLLPRSLFERSERT